MFNFDKIYIKIYCPMIFVLIVTSILIVNQYKKYQEKPINISELHDVIGWNIEYQEMRSMINECYKENNGKYINNRCYKKMLTYLIEKTERDLQIILDDINKLSNEINQRMLVEMK